MHTRQGGQSREAVGRYNNKRWDSFISSPIPCTCLVAWTVRLMRHYLRCASELAPSDCASFLHYPKFHSEYGTYENQPTINICRPRDFSFEIIHTNRNYNVIDLIIPAWLMRCIGIYVKGRTKFPWKSVDARWTFQLKMSQTPYLNRKGPSIRDLTHGQILLPFQIGRARPGPHGQRVGHYCCLGDFPSCCSNRILTVQSPLWSKSALDHTSHYRP